MISLDVISLYTNTPTNIALDVIKSRWNDIKNFTNLTKDSFCEAVQMCLNSSYFCYNGKIL